MKLVTLVLEGASVIDSPEKRCRRRGRGRVTTLFALPIRIRGNLKLSVPSTLYGHSVPTAAKRNEYSAPPLEHHHPLGISTGVFARDRGNWPELVKAASSASVYVTELSALSEPELDGLERFLATSPRLPFRYVSVHAPAKKSSLSKDRLVQRLGKLPRWVRSVIAHPDRLRGLEQYRALGSRLVLENMDDRKADGRTADEMERFFRELPEAGFCLDVAHVYSLDPRMDLAHELLDRFGDRLRQVHLSSLRDGRHVPVCPEDEELFESVLARCGDVPWIMEAEIPDRWGHRATREPVTSLTHRYRERRAISDRMIDFE